MNQDYQRQFTAQALKAGVPQEKIAALLTRADQISRRSNVKTASTGFNIVDGLLIQAKLQKTASSVAYTEGLLSEAFHNGANLPQALNFAKQALDATSEKLAFMSKVAEIQNSPALSKYAEGFLASAKQAGIADDEALSLLINVIDREKRADDGSAMFKQPAAPDADPSAGAPPGGPAGGPPGAGGPPPGAGAPPGADPSQGGDPMSGPGAAMGGPGGQEEQQLLQLLQSLPPQEQQQIIQQLLAAIGGQGGDPSQGGPDGPAGAGAPPHHAHHGGHPGAAPSGPPQ